MLHGVFHRGGVERFAVLKRDVGAEVEEQGLWVGPLVAEGELRHDLQLFVDVEELVAKAGEDDAADVGAGEGGVEDVGVFPQGDAQGLRLGRGRGEQGGQAAQGSQQATMH